jgi:hypothetical protein
MSDHSDSDSSPGRLKKRNISPEEQAAINERKRNARSAITKK